MPVVTGAEPSARVAASALRVFSGTGDRDDIARGAVELAREQIGLDRVAFFFVDRRAGVLLGAWGTDFEGRTTDEHHVVCGAASDVRLAFRQANEGIPWGLIQNCPLVAHVGQETRVAGRGWVAYTPVLSASGPIGMMFNDSGLSGRAVAAEKQTLLAIVCAFLGGQAQMQGRRLALAPSVTANSSPVVVDVASSLAQDPSLSGTALAKRSGLSISRLAWVLRKETGLSLVQYRNRLRLDTFFSTVDRRRQNLLQAALQSGFGSYAQFHRVFRAFHGVSPRDFFRAEANGGAASRNK